MSPKAKNVNVSSVKSMDITTKEKDKMPEVESKKPEIVKPKSMIKDISVHQADEDDNIDNTPKIETSENLVTNLKPPSVTKKVITPIEESKVEVKEKSENEKIADLESNEEEGKSDADDLTNDNEEHDTSFIDNIMDKKDTKKDSKLDEEIKPDAEEDTEIVEDKEEKPKQKEQEEQPDRTSGDENGGIVNELAEQAADNKKQKKEDKELEVRANHIEDLIEAKTYNVPIAQLSHKRNTRMLIFLLLLLIIGGLVALNFAVDAGVVDIGVEPLTNIFEN